MKEEKSVEVPAVDLNKSITDLCLEYLHSPAGRQKLQSHVEGCLDHALKVATASYSPFAKTLEEMFAQALNLGAHVDVPSYNDAVLNIVRLRMATLSQEWVQLQMAKHLDELLAPVPKEIKLSELIQKYLDYLTEEAKEECVCGTEDYTAFVRLAEDRIESLTLKGFRTLYLSAHPVKEKDYKHDCDIQLGFHNNEMHRLRFKSWTHESQIFQKRVYGFDRYLFHMKVAGTKVIFDIDQDGIENDFSFEYGPDSD